MVKMIKTDPKNDTKAPPVEHLVMRDRRRIADSFTEVIGRNLHYFESSDQIDLATCAAKDITDLSDGWLHRYQNESMFHAKVESTVASLMHALDA